MALAQRRLGLKNKFLENNQIRPHFFAFDRFTLQILANKSRGVYTNILYFLYITSEVKQDYLSYRPRMHSVNIQDDQSWAFSETVQKKFQNHPYGQPVLTSSASRQCGRVFE